MESQSVPEAAGVKGVGGLSSGEYGFLALMVLVFIIVGWIGMLSYGDGLKTEKTKHNGETWAAWLTENSAKRFEAGYALAACAGGPAAAVALEPAAAIQPTEPTAATEPTAPNEQAPSAEGETLAKAAPAAPAAAAPKTWGTCLEAILKNTELKDVVNPFTGKPPEFIEKCDPADYTLHGNIAIEKSVANPVGSAVAATVSPLVAADAIDTKLQLKLSICDKGAYPVKVSEFEF